MYNDYGWAAGAGIGFFIFALVLYLGTLALAIWIGYILMRTAVKNGVILAMRETGQQFPPGYRPGGPQAGPYRGSPPASPPGS